MADRRWMALTHWIVVSSPTELVRMYGWTDDDGNPWCRSPQDAARRFLDECRNELEDHAREGAAELDELELLVFERGNESGRYVTVLDLEAIQTGDAKDWRPEPDEPASE